MTGINFEDGSLFLNGAIERGLFSLNLSSYEKIIEHDFPKFDSKLDELQADLSD